MELSHDLQQELLIRVKRKLEGDVEVSEEQIKDTALQILEEISQGTYYTVEEQLFVVRQVLDQIKHLGVLQPLLDDPFITEIMINGPNHIFYERAGRLFQSSVVFEGEKQLEDIIQRIVGKVNRTVNSLNPICDARLEDGSRVNIVLPPIALNGATVTIRKFPEKVVDFEDLIAWGSVTREVAEFLKCCVKAKYNIFVSGGTGSGKTTFLNALSNFIPSDERIITIEDSAELQIQTIKNLVRLETRQANTEGKGEISIRDLIKSSLRMRPERIVVGEVRGAEALDMLQAMNTGHDGSLSTGHANSPVDMLSRLETMVLTGANFPIEAIRQQIGAAIDLIIHLGRLSDKSRKVLEIVELVAYQDGAYQLNPLYHYTIADEKKGRLLPTGNSLVRQDKLKMNGVMLNPSWAVSKTNGVEA